MAKTTKKKRARLETSPFALIRSTTGREFQRAGIRFAPDRDEPVNLDKLEPKDRERLLGTKQLAVTYVSESEYAAAIDEQQTEEAEALEGLDPIELQQQLAIVTAERDALRAEVALLTGRRPKDGGPRENDDKPADKPLVG